MSTTIDIENAKQIRERFHVPVLDVNTMIGYMAYAIGQMKMYD